jgi:paraquat-inducible protein A
MLVIAQAYPIIELDMGGIRTEATLADTVTALWTQGMWPAAIFLACLTIILPFVDLLAQLYVLIPIRFGIVPPAFSGVLRMIHAIRPWCMLEVMLSGIFVTALKISSNASVTPETALFALVVLSLLLTSFIAFDPQALWDTAEALKSQTSREVTAGRMDRAGQPTSIAAGGGFIVCRHCHKIEPYTPVSADHTRTGHQDQIASRTCSRCGSTIYRRKPHSLMRTWALLVAAALLYLPANLLPILHTTSILGKREDTIVSGVVHLWTSGDRVIAIVVVVASVLFPLFKLLTLAVLAWTTQRESSWPPSQRMKLFRVVEHLGRWSMLDVFVVATTITLVNFGPLATATAGWGITAFSAVVVLTMLAAMQFDPRLIWDNHADRIGTR